MQSRSHSPDDSVSDQTRKTKGVEIGHERSTGKLSQTDNTSHTTSNNGDIPRNLLEWSQSDDCGLVDGCYGGGRWCGYGGAGRWVEEFTVLVND